MTRPREAQRAATDTLIQANRALVTRIAKRYLGRGLDFEELNAEGNLALVQAAGGYDRSRGVAFQTFAAKRIEGVIRDALRRWTVQQPRTTSFQVLAESEEDDAEVDEYDTPLLADYTCDPGQLIDPDDESGHPVCRRVRNQRPCRIPLAQARKVGGDFVVGTPLGRDPYLVRRPSDLAQVKQVLAALLARRAS
jgi:RNA polymerase sigma factor (sigma-70 family)